MNIKIYCKSSRYESLVGKNSSISAILKTVLWGGGESDGAYIILEVASVCNPLELVSDTDIFTDPSERI